MIRSTVTVIAFFLLSSAAFSQTDEQLELCGVMAGVAESTMKARQDGGRMSDLMGIVGKEETFGEIGKMIVIRAFEEPAYGSEEIQKRTIRDFENTIYLECIKSAPK